MIPNLDLYVGHEGLSSIEVVDGLVHIRADRGNTAIKVSCCKTVEQFVQLCRALGVEPWESFTPGDNEKWPPVVQIANRWGDSFSDIIQPLLIAGASYRKLRGT